MVTLKTVTLFVRKVVPTLGFRNHTSATEKASCLCWVYENLPRHSFPQRVWSLTGFCLLLPLTVPRLWLRHTPQLLACSKSWALSQRVPDSSTPDSAQRQISRKFKPKPHHTKIKVVKEGEKKGRHICKDLKQCVKKPKGHLKH